MKKLLILSILSILSTGCVNPNCQDMANKKVDNRTFDECINTAMMIPGRMGIIPPQEIDDCAHKASQVTASLCQNPFGLK